MKFFLFFLLFIIISCNKEKQEVNEVYDILNQIYPLLSAEIPPPVAPPAPSSVNDSLNLNYNYSVEVDRNHLVTKQIIAIKSEFYDLEKSKIINSGSAFGKITYGRTISNLDSINIDLIISSNNDSIVTFSKELLEPQMKDYLKFDKLIRFSEVIFDKDLNHAVVIGTVGTSSLAASSHIFFLRKEEGHWMIVDVKLLEIS